MAAQDKIITLITGGNSGIGKCLAGLLLEDPNRHVIITSRSADKGADAVKELEALGHPGSVETLPLDLTKPESIEALAKEVDKKYRRLDALVNNAAAGTAAIDHLPTQDKFQESFKSNATGAYLMLQAFWPLIKRSTTTARIINVSSGGGSIQIMQKMKWPWSGEWPYHYFMSKAALNMLSGVWSSEHEGDNFKMFTYCPGYTVSNLGPNNTLEKGAKPTEEGARPMVVLLKGERDAEAGSFVNSEGGHHPW